MTIVELAHDDISTATTIPEFIRALRHSAENHNPAKVTNPECSTMKIQYESIAATERSIADALEKLQDGIESDLTEDAVR